MPKPREIAKRRSRPSTEIGGVLLVLFSLLMGWTGAEVGAAPTGAGSAKRVLILHSYHEGFSWTDGIEKGLRTALDGESAEIFTEYLDSKRQPLDVVGPPAVAYLARKYAAVPPDVVVVSDNNALALLREHQQTLFPDTPIVFCGINNFQPALIDGFDGRVTGVVEKTDPAATLKLIRTLQPDTQKLYIVTGMTPTAAAVRADVEAGLAENAHGFSPVWLEGLSADELEHRLASVSPSDAVLLVLLNRDKDGVYRTYAQAAELVSSASPAPVYGMWDFYLGHGIVGGMMASSHDQGRTAGALARAILNGDDLPSVVDKSPNAAIFLWHELRAHGLNPALLPADVEIRGRPEKNKWPVVVAAGLGGLLLALVALSLIGLLRGERHAETQTVPTVFRRNLRRAVVLLAAPVLAGVTVQSMISVRQESERVYNVMLTEKKILIRTIVDQAIDLIDYGRTRMRQQGLAEKDIQEVLKKRLAAISFQDGKNYVFATSFDGVVLVNRSQPDIVGQNIYHQTDPDGVKLVQELIAAAQRPGGGFVEYQWHKPGTNDATAKLSYARGVPDWGWMVGAGLYQDDIEAAVLAVQQRLWRRLGTELTVIFGLVVGVVLLLEIPGRRLTHKIKSELGELQHAINHHQVHTADYSVQEFQAIADVSAQSFEELALAQAALERSETTQREILESLDVGVIIIDQNDHAIRYANATAAHMIGVARDEMVGQLCHRYICRDGEQRCPTTDLGQTIDSSRRVLLAADGGTIPVLKSARTFTFQGQPALLETFVDVSVQEENQRQLESANAELNRSQQRLVSMMEDARAARDRLTSIIEGTNVGTWEWNVQTGQTAFNERWADICGYTLSELSPVSIDTWKKLAHPDDLRESQVLLERHFAGQLAFYDDEIRMKHKDGHWVWIHDRGRVVSWTDDGKPLMMFGTHQDITERKLIEQELEEAATTDKLTGLPNRRAFIERLDQRLRLSRRDDSAFAVLFFDFDRFKVVNDSLGHDVGDALLIDIADIFRRALRESDTAARFGGDEFVVLLGTLTDPADAATKANRLLEAFAEPHVIQGHRIVSTASIGLVTNIFAYDSATDMVRDADAAMYQAKAAGKGQVVTFDHAMHETALERLQLEADLREAIGGPQFLLHYQPIVNLVTGSADGFEALVRWHHPERGLIRPDIFIPIAEETGLIEGLGHWVARTAARQIADWNADRSPAERLFVNINISKRELINPDLIEWLLDCRREFGLQPDDFRLEITESAIADERLDLIPTLTRLREQGFQIALDDFGTGLSSLGSLHNYPIDTLKIDRSFVFPLDSDRSLLAVVSAITALAENLEIPVVAEGIETKDVVGALQSIDCQWGQGYYFARPMPASEAEAYLLTKPNHSADAA
jgi:diguanylate cyclase (GGDEF)-like protein/PAS domain S-box-containing protein